MLQRVAFRANPVRKSTPMKQEVRFGGLNSIRGLIPLALGLEFSELRKMLAAKLCLRMTSQPAQTIPCNQARGGQMNNSNIDLVPLQQASLCLDCEGITAAHTTCLCCGSQALLNVARILNERTFDARHAEKPLPLCFPSLPHRAGARMEPGMHPLAHRQHQPLRFPSRITGNRA
jgi:hypothetical protein